MLPHNQVLHFYIFRPIHICARP